MNGPNKEVEEGARSPGPWSSLWKAQETIHSIIPSFIQLIFVNEPCGFEATYLELASAVKEQYPGIEIESRLGGTGAFEIEINGQLVFSKLENGGFPYEKDLIEAIRRASNGEPLEKITNSRPPCVIL
ncbi:migration and invasion enhancer 1 isoform X1 [Saccopteryx bilineata]|uniref:migration and invasion enhancer 1 isoform X1 n=1 Tax=Saccopteryx bilineata TaxID=59482 RepID=UPI00338E5934